MANDIGLKIELEGEQDFFRALRQIDSEIRVHSSELSLVAAQYGRNTNELEGLTAEQNALTRAIEAQTQKVNALSQGWEIMAERHGENSRQANITQTNLNRAQAEVVRLTKGLEDNKTAQAHLTDEAKKSSRGVVQLGDAFDEAGQKTLSFTDVVKASAFGDILADIIRKATSAMTNFISEGQAYSASLDEVQNVVDTVFGAEGGRQLDEWSKTSMEVMGVAQLTAKDFASTLGSIIHNTGIATDKNLEMSTSLSAISSDWASFRDLPIEQTFNAIRSATTGQTQAINNMGLAMNVGLLEVYALEKGIRKKYNTMSEAEKMTLRYNYIMDKSAHVVGDFGANIDTLHNQQQLLENQTKQLSGAFADNFTPSITRSLTSINEYLLENADKLANLGQIVALVVDVLADFLKVLLSIPPELIIVIGGALTLVKTFVEINNTFKLVKKGSEGLSTGVKLLTQTFSPFELKIMAVIGTLTILLFLLLALKEGADKAAHSISSLGGKSGNIQGGNLNAYATGTTNAKRGPALVGEQGPELVWFNGGEGVLNAARTSRALSVGTGGVNPKAIESSAYHDNRSLTIYTDNDQVLTEVKNWWSSKRLDARMNGNEPII